MRTPFIEVDSKKIIRILSDNSSCDRCYFKIEQKYPPTYAYNCRLDTDGKLNEVLCRSEIPDCLGVNIYGDEIDFIYVESDGV